MTGDAVDASTAQRLGLVNRVVPGEQVLAAELSPSGSAATPPWPRSRRRRPSEQAVKLLLDGTEDEEFDLQGHLLVGMPSWPDAMTDPKGLADKRQPDRTSA